MVASIAKETVSALPFGLWFVLSERLPMSEQIENVVIIGTGCAGLTAAIYTARANLNPLVIEGALPGGQLTTTSEVENYPGFETGIDGFTLMDTMRKQAARFGTRFQHGTIESVDFTSNPRRLILADGEIQTRAVIIATGASPRLLGLPAEKALYGGGGVTTCATCDGAFYRNMDVVVVGRGGGVVSDPLLQQGYPDPPSGRIARLENHARPRPRA